MKPRIVMKYRALTLIYHRKYDITNSHKCPICGQHEFPYRGSFFACRVCNWLDDGYQEIYPDEDGCGNNISLNEYKKYWAEKIKQNEHTTIRKME